VIFSSFFGFCSLSRRKMFFSENRVLEKVLEN
jgi:hypothetical protein